MKRVLATIAVLGLVASIANAQADDLKGTWPAEGGPITLTNTGAPIAAQGLEINSPGNLLIPAADNNAAPFAFALSNTAGKYTVGNLGTTVSLEGDLTLAVGHQAGPEPALTSTVGVGGAPVAFPIEVIPEPASGVMAAFALLGLLGFRRRR